MQLKFIGDVGLKFLRAMYSSSVYVQPLSTAAFRVCPWIPQRVVQPLGNAVRRVP